MSKAIPDPYARVSVHGTLPVIVDSESGRLRFARIGHDAPEDCVSDPSGLPDIQYDLFAFRQSSDLLGWKDGVLEAAANTVEVVVAEVRWPRFALLARHDRPGRSGNTLEEAIAFRSLSATGISKDAAVAAGYETRTREAAEAAADREAEAFRISWREELGLLQACAGMDLQEAQSIREGRPVAILSIGEMRGLGPSIAFDRGDGLYVAVWQPLALLMPEGAAERILEAAETFGGSFDGRTVRLQLDALDERAMDLLQRAVETVQAALEAPSAGPTR